MRRPAKILTIIGASVGGFVVLVIATALIVVQTSWFANFVKNKIISATEESTGGVVQIGSFDVDLAHLTIRMRNCVLHGTEPSGSSPLLSIALIELKLKLFSGIYHVIDLNYLGVQRPQVNLIMLPNGGTNIPQPKVPQPSSNTNALETVIDLKVNSFNLSDGLLSVLNQQMAFHGRGQNLRALLTYDAAHPSYNGNLSMAPVQLTFGNKPPLDVNVNLPIAISGNTVEISNARLTTAQSQVGFSASLRNLKSPVLAANMNANISMIEMQRSTDIPLDATAPGTPKNLIAAVALSLDEGANVLQVQLANIALGETTLHAAGRTGPSVKGSIQFQADFALQQLARLLQVKSVQLAGDLRATGAAALKTQGNYSLDGVISSRGLAVGSGATRVPDIDLETPFHADPYLVSLNGLRLKVLGGALAGKIFLEKMQELSVETSLRNFSLPVLASAFAGKPLGYAGSIDGSLNAKGDLKAKGTSGYSAQTHLLVVPGGRGVPVSGRVDATYAGMTGIVDVGQSYLALPNTRLDIAGALNKRIDLKLVSRNLNDFLPALNFESTTPESSLPLALRGGTATVTAQITGNLSNPDISAQLAVGRFAVEQHAFDQLSLSLNASQSGAMIQNGVLAGQGLQSNFAGSIGLVKWKPVPRSPLEANLTMQSGNIADVLALAGESSLQASGQLTAGLHIRGTYGDPLGSATLQVINGRFDNQPFSRLYGNVNLARQLVTLSNLEMDTAGGQLAARGIFQHPADSFLQGHAELHLAANNVQLANVQPLQQKQAVAGMIHLNFDTAADIVNSGGRTQVRVSNVSGDFSAADMKLDNKIAGDLTAAARTSNGVVTYKVASNFAGSSIRVDGHTQLNNDYPTLADAAIQNLSINKTLEIVGESSLPASGTLSADAHLSGTLRAPDAHLAFDLSHANVYQERIERLHGSLQYSKTLLNVPSVELQAPAGSMTLSGSFSHAANKFNSGVLTLKVNSTPIQLSKVEHVSSQAPGLQGTLQLAANLSAQLRSQPNGSLSPRFSSLDAKVALRDVSLNGSQLGEAGFNANTSGSTLHFELDSDLAASEVRGSGQVQLSGDYQAGADVTFTNVRYSKLAPLFGAATGASLPVEALVEGEASVNGPVLKPDNLSGELQLTRLDVETNPQGSPTGAPAIRRVDLQNQGPIVLKLARSVVHVQELQIAGPGTTISASGGFDLKNQRSPMGLKLAATLNLGILQDVDKDFISSGGLALDATLHGSFSQPLVNGRIDLKDANVNYINSPNGLSNGNGVILLNGASATIQTLTGRTGGGTLSATGFVGFSGRALTFNLKAVANKVRVLYSGISVTSNANLALIGTTRRSLLNGSVSVTRIAYNSSSDAGSLLSVASTPPSTSAPSPLLTGLHLDVHILTAPDLRVISTYTQSLDVLANLTLRGTAETPGILGRITVTNGQLVFFGNTYTVDTGTINFYDPAAIQPVLNISLETVAQGVTVTIGVEGPIDNLKLTYRSDPPLTFQQIVTLLATNTTPANPVIAAQQPAPPQQSFTQMGESALLGQAVANPLASRVQRVFGLTELKIDPAIASNTSSSSNSLDATVTLQQKVTSNITFTYITDVSQTNGQIIRIEWDLTPRLSAVALHDYNGNVSVEMFYKFTRR